MDRSLRAWLWLAVTLGMLAAVTCKIWSGEDCPTKLLEFERRPCFPINENVTDEECEAREGCIYCDPYPGIPSAVRCFNNTRPGLYWEADGRQDACPSSVALQDRVDCFANSWDNCTSDYCTQAFCFAIGCEWCKNDQAAPDCFHKTEAGRTIPQPELVTYRNLGGTYAAIVIRPVLPRDTPVTSGYLYWTFDFTFGVPVKDIKFGGGLGALYSKPGNTFTWIPRFAHWDPFTVKPQRFFLTATLDRQSPDYTPVARGRLNFRSAPRYAMGHSSVPLPEFLRLRCVVSFEFDPEIRDIGFGKSAVKYSFDSGDSVLAQVHLITQRRASAIMSNDYYVFRRVAYTQDYMLQMLRLKPDGAERSPGTYSLVMLYDTSDGLELHPELAFRIPFGADTLPKKDCGLEYES